MPCRTIGLLITLALGFLMASLATVAQRGKIPLVGMLTLISPADLSRPKTPHQAFRQGLRDLGYVEGRNILLEYRFAEQQLNRLPTLAAELVQRKRCSPTL